MDYSKHPKTIMEVKAERTGAAREWTPRDALISVLRSIDSGEVNATAAIVVVKTEPKDREGEAGVYYMQASPDVITSLGMIEVAKLQIFEGNEDEAN